MKNILEQAMNKVNVVDSEFEKDENLTQGRAKICKNGAYVL